MRKLIKSLVFLLIIISPLPSTVRAEAVTKINDLIEHAKTLDGQELVIEGEAIGERMIRGDYSWTNINDGSNAIGVYLNNTEPDKINFYGNYKNIGDKVRITGIFQRACNKHGGEADFHAESLEVVKRGYPVDIPVSTPKIIAAVVLSATALLLFIIYHRIKVSSYSRRKNLQREH
jgi:hypothetical protein